MRRLTLAFAILAASAMTARAAELSAAELELIAAHVRPCWPPGDAALPADTSVTMDIVTEVDGTAIDVASVETSARMLAYGFSPAQRTLASRAKQALLDPRCSRLPMPAGLLGHRQSFKLVFGP